MYSARSHFIAMIAECAVKDWQERHLCIPSLAIALALDGTNWGRKQEWIKKKELYPYRRDQLEKRYESFLDAVRSHNNYLATWREGEQDYPNWEKLIGARHYILVVQYLQDAKYPYYSEKLKDLKLIDIIEGYRLSEFDW